MFRLRAHTGPTQVRQIASFLKQAGASEIMEGTAWVYWTFPGSSVEEAITDSLNGLKRVTPYRTDLGLRPIPVR